ncbi:hypothetical protein HID58_085466 [Brassica napus]|uniref:(rape) hypothetical protein n=2 Tax=Brassica napus TaxID=3708 RepID=A0A816IS79_BRANA|nr:hypothetical protein HID58_085466 [Brassica napus]CAF1720041.1 unnamed protein product [Brassica napus]
MEKYCIFEIGISDFSCRKKKNFAYNFVQTSCSHYGALNGSIVAFNIADIIGLKELVTAAFLYLVGAILTATAPVFPVLISGRVVYGIGLGLTMHAAPIYIAETAPSQIHGWMISLKEFTTVFGMVGGCGIGSLWITVVSGWRYMYATVILIPVTSFPYRWLLLLRSLQGKEDVESLQQEEIKSLRRLKRVTAVDTAAEQVDEILAELSSVGEDKEATISELFQGKCLKALTIAGGLVLFQQVSAVISLNVRKEQ